MKRRKIKAPKNTYPTFDELDFSGRGVTAIWVSSVESGFETGDEMYSKESVTVAESLIKIRFCGTFER